MVKEDPRIFRFLYQHCKASYIDIIKSYIGFSPGDHPVSFCAKK